MLSNVELQLNLIAEKGNAITKGLQQPDGSSVAFFGC